jgi:hypothetical protein
MAHSVAKFVTVNPIAGEVNGKIFGFTGNRQMDQEPRAVLIPTIAWMAWAYHKVGGDAKAMTDHYRDKPTMASSTKSRGQDQPPMFPTSSRSRSAWSGS